jgi:hypothetical protein
LGVQVGLTSVANEVVVLVMVGGAGSTSACGPRLVVVARDDIDKSTSTVFRLAGKTFARTPVTASSSSSSCREWWGWRRVGLQWGESGEGEQGEWRQRWGECGRCGSV